MKQKRRVVFTECASEGPEMVHMVISSLDFHSYQSCFSKTF